MTNPYIAKILLLIAIQCAPFLYGEDTSAKRFDFPAEMTGASLAQNKQQVWLVPGSGELTSQPWWALPQKSFQSEWWKSGARTQFDAITAFQAHARGEILPKVGKNYEAVPALERFVDCTGLSDEFEVKRHLKAQVELLKKLPQVDWSKQHLITISGASRGPYDFTAGGFLINTPHPSAVYLQKPQGVPESGAVVKLDSLQIPVMSLYREEYTKSKLGKDPAIQFEVDANKLFVKLDEATAEEWTKTTNGAGSLVSWVTPVKYYCGGTDRALGAYCGLLCKVECSALYFPKKEDKNRFIKVASWTEGDKDYENRLIRKYTILPSDLISLK